MAKNEKEQTVTGQSQEELLAIIEALKADKVSLQESVDSLTSAQGEQESAKARAIEAAVAQFKKAESHKLGTPNTIPGVAREPKATKLADGTIRTDF